MKGISVQDAAVLGEKHNDTGGARLQGLLAWVLLVNAAVFILGAIQHVGIALGSFSEPRVIPAAIMETLCGVALVWGAAAAFRHTGDAWRTSLIANSVALSGVIIGMVMLAVGLVPRTATNDFYQRTILALIAVVLIVLLVDYRRVKSSVRLQGC